MVYNFDNSKKTVLGKLDKSNIGGWDKPIVNLCEKINKNKNYYTTSSCSGRIMLIIETLDKKSGLFLFRSHGKISFDELRKEIEKAKAESNKIIYFKQEPCVVAVACREVGDAQKLVNLARGCGWKRSGITTTSKKNIIELFSTEKLELPIIDKGKVLVDDAYLRLILREANNRLERTWEKIKKLEKRL